MLRLGFAAPVLALALCGGQALAQSYYDTTDKAKTGYGFAPATVVAGWEKEASFTVLAITPNGPRAVRDGVVTEWKAILTTGPRQRRADDDDFVDERYLAPDAAPVQARAQAPAKAAPKAPEPPPVARTVVSYTSTACPALAVRLEALKPLTAFDFNPANQKSNIDGPFGDGHGGLDLWVRIGDAEISRSAGTANSALGRWYQDTLAALAACPVAP